MKMLKAKLAKIEEEKFENELQQARVSIKTLVGGHKFATMFCILTN
jgi:hypothetical protein